MASPSLIVSCSYYTLFSLFAWYNELMNSFLDAIRTFVRSIMRQLARALNKLSGGKLHPNVVTIIGLLAFFPIGLYLIPQGLFVSAGLATIVFGLLDTLDGELARLQNRANPTGMFLDSVTDRMKEILLYVGLAIYWTSTNSWYTTYYTGMFGDEALPWVVLALGLSLLVSYINAWGEVVITRSGAGSAKPNTVFRGGLASYEIRITILAVGLLFSQYITYALALIILLTSITIVSRIRRVIKHLR